MSFILNRAFLIGIFLNILFSSTLLTISTPWQVDLITNRKLFFTDRSLNWDDYVGKEILYSGNKSGLKCLKTVPKYISVAEFNSILTRVHQSDERILRLYYRENEENYSLRELTDISVVMKIEKIFNGIFYNKFDYVMFFYNIARESGKIYYFGSIYYRFNYNKELVESKVFFQDSNLSYLQFDSYKKNKFDIYMFGKMYKKDLSYFFPIESLKFLGIDSIFSLLSECNIDKEILIDNDDSELKERLISKVILPSLNPNYKIDGAKNEFGEYVDISTENKQILSPFGFNCSGFVKEVTDQLLKLRDKEFKWLPIKDLKKKRYDERKENSYVGYDDSLDPFFGLDWTKNLVDKINYYYNYKIIKAEQLTNDQYSQHFGDNGYYFKDLQEIIFRDQKKDSSYFYFIVFNKLRDTKPMVPTFYHIAVLVPYFSNNKFAIRVYESGEETNFDNIIKRMIPNSISEKRFNSEILNRLSNQDEIDMLKAAFKYSKGSYILNADISKNDSIRIRNILDSIEFDKEKVTIFKIPLPINYLISENY